MRRISWVFGGLSIISTFFVSSGIAHAGSTSIPIATCAQLQAINTDVTAAYELTADIDCSGFNFVPIMEVGSGNAFTGTLEGNNHTINHLTIDQSGTINNTGLFGMLRYGASIQNLTISDATVTGGYETGILVGEIYSYQGHNIPVTNVHVSGHVNSVHANIQQRLTGGLAGYSQFGDISNSSANVTIDGSDTLFVGGLVGASNDTTFTNVHSSGSIHCTTTCTQVGGLIGSSVADVITNSYSRANLNGAITIAGGLVGLVDINSTLMRVFATGNIDSTEPSATDVGGLIGRMSSGSIEDAFALGTVTANGATAAYIGGLVGNDDAANDYRNMYATGTVTAIHGDYVGGLFGKLHDDSFIRSSFTRNKVIAPAATHRGSFAGAFDPSGNGLAFNSWYDKTTSLQTDCTVPASNSCVYSIQAVNDDGLSPDYFYNNDTAQPFRLNGGTFWDFGSTWQTANCTPVLQFAPIDTCPVLAVAVTNPLVTAASPIQQPITSPTVSKETLVDTGLPIWLATLFASVLALLSIACYMPGGRLYRFITVK